MKAVCQNKYPIPNNHSVTTAQYAECFEDFLYMSANLEHVYLSAIPIFHRDAKSVDFILVVEEKDECYFVLVSKKDAGFFKEWIIYNQPVNVWLVNLDGLPEAEEKSCSFVEKRKTAMFNVKIDKGLWQANFYQGNIHYLEDHKDLSIQQTLERKLFSGNT